MKELARMGYRSVVITSDSNHLAEPPVLRQPYMHQLSDGMDLWWVRTLKYNVAKSSRRILSWLDFEWRLYRMPKKDMPVPDAIIVSSLSLLTIVNGFLLRRRFGSRLVFEIRDIWPLTLTEEGGYSIRNPFVKFLGWVEYLGYRKADAIVGTMPNLREHVSEVLREDKCTHCVPMGIDTTVNDDQAELSPEYVERYMSSGKFVVAHVGTIGITNALDTFFESAAALKGRSDIHFLIVGDGDLRKKYQEKYGNLPNLTFGPKVEKQMVQSVLEKCDLLYFSVHKSKVWRFGQSLNKVIDYMLAGKPIIASYSGFPSMINEAECGSYIPPGDASRLGEEIIRYSRLSADERDRIGAKGSEWLKKNRNYEKLAGDYLKILFPVD
ncbi:MAG: glycosyltransferase family 4 protein [Sedimenticola sp.]|nr:glycosyltransferase family 4 protein [Sedimenticola sp.]